MSEMVGRATTAAQLLELPDDGWRRELVRGELRRASPAGGQHGSVAMRLGLLLGQHVVEHGLGEVFAAETGFWIEREPDTVRAPDVAFVSAERIASHGLDRGYWSGAPDFAAEVVSPSDSFAEVEAKVVHWLDAGTRLVLVVTPLARTVTVYRSRDDVRILGEDGVIDGGDVVPGWRAAVRDVFAGLPSIR